MPTTRPASRYAVTAAVSARPLATSRLVPGLLSLALLGGCAADNPMHQALRNSVSFGGPTEQGFAGMVERNCGQEYVGGQSVATLMQTDSSFRQLASRLYRGDLSTDAFTQLLLEEYPAPDANVPATGCVAKQLNVCMSTRCDGSPAASPDSIEADQIDSVRDETLDQIAGSDRDEIDELLADPAESMPDASNAPINVAPSAVEEMQEQTQP